MKMHSILIPIDGSRHARRALRYAISSIKEGLQAEVHVITVEPDVLPMGDLPLLDIEFVEKSQHEQAKRVIRSAGRILKNAGLSYTKNISQGSIASNIVRYAKAHGCDSIIMGTRGMGMLGNIVLGSTANQVIHLAKIPVTLVK
jgi:nucleotide-binding universal stress UspA family protein